MARTKSEAARSKMLTAALEICMEDGVDNVTVAEIVNRSGVAKTTFYRHFDSVSELIVCSIETHHEPSDLPDTGSLRSDLFAIYELMMPRFSQPERRQMMTSLLHASSKDAKLCELHNRMVDSNSHPVEAVLKNAVDRGELPAGTNIGLAAEFVEGPFVKRVLVRQVDMNEGEALQLIDWICKGLGATDLAQRGLR